MSTNPLSESLRELLRNERRTFSHTEAYLIGQAANALDDVAKLEATRAKLDAASRYTKRFAPTSPNLIAALDKACVPMPDMPPEPEPAPLAAQPAQAGEFFPIPPEWLWEEAKRVGLNTVVWSGYGEHMRHVPDYAKKYDELARAINTRTRRLFESERDALKAEVERLRGQIAEATSEGGIRCTPRDAAGGRSLDEVLADEQELRADLATLTRERNEARAEVGPLRRSRDEWRDIARTQQEAARLRSAAPSVQTFDEDALADDIVRLVNNGGPLRVVRGEVLPLIEKRRREVAVEVSEAVEELVSAVSEQQHTLQSKGWNVEYPKAYSEAGVERIGNRLEWSAAGARRHQYDRIERALAALSAIGCKAGEAKP